MKSILVTGSAGFIGANLVLRLLGSQELLHIVGLDNMNSYYYIHPEFSNWHGNVQEEML